MHGLNSNMMERSTATSFPVYLNSNSTPQEPTQISTIPLSQLVIWCVAFALVAVAIIIGNILTIRVFSRKKLLRMRANCFLITLAVADLLVGAFAVPLYIHQLVWYWKTNSNDRGSYVAHMAIDIFTGFASIFALTIIALERLYAVMYPLKHRVVSKCTYYLLIAVVWVLSALVAVLYFMNGLKVFKLKVFFYFIIFFISSSLLVICIAYVLIWVKVTLHKQDAPRRRSKYQEDIEQNKRSKQEKNLVTTLLILTLVFVLTWVPFYILNIVVFFHAKWGSSHIPFEAFCFTKLLHYSNSFANPIVYSIRIPRFKRSLLGSFRRRKKTLLRSLRLSKRQ